MNELSLIELYRQIIIDKYELGQSFDEIAEQVPFSALDVVSVIKDFKKVKPTDGNQ